MDGGRHARTVAKIVCQEEGEVGLRCDAVRSEGCGKVERCKHRRHHEHVGWVRPRMELYEYVRAAAGRPRVISTAVSRYSDMVENYIIINTVLYSYTRIIDASIVI